MILGTEFTNNKSPNDPFPPEWGKFPFPFLEHFYSYTCLFDALTNCGYVNHTGVGAYFGAQCEKHGLLVNAVGDNIMMSPPLIISEEEIDEVNLLFN